MGAKRRKRYLIVNADDFGQSHGVNRGIIEAHECGIVTSASLMVRWPAAEEAAAYSRKHAELSVGLHFDLAEWACRDYEWVQLYQVIPEEDSEGVSREAFYQLAAFRRLVGRDPTHLDSHQHVHLDGPSRRVLGGISRRLRIPLRSCSRKIRYSGSFYGQNEQGWPLPDFISVKALIKVLMKLPPGFTELGCHPGFADDLDSMYQRERALEIKTLCDPRIRAAVARMGIELASFHAVAHSRDGAPGNRGQRNAI